MPNYHVTIVGGDYDAMADLARRYEIPVFRHTVRQLDQGGYSVDAVIDAEQVASLRAQGYQIELHEDVEEMGKSRQSEVGTGEEYQPS